MKTSSFMAGSLAIATTVAAGTGSAQERDEVIRRNGSSVQFPAIQRAVELTVASGLTQSFAGVTTTDPLTSEIGGAGGELRGSVGYRIIPELAISLYGSGAMIGRGQLSDRSMKLGAATAGVQLEWHLLPRGAELDPWISLGTGWRGYWVSSDAPAPGQGAPSSTSLQGLQMGKLQVGLDYRVGPTLAISPILGADVSTFLWETRDDAAGVKGIAQMSTFVFAGLLGRFDIPTTKKEPPQVAAR